MTRNIDVSEWSNDILRCVGIALLQYQAKLQEGTEIAVMLGAEPPPHIADAIKKIKDGAAEVHLLLDVLEAEAKERVLSKKENTDA